MAGMLPGVEMHRRIRAGSQRLRDDNTICSAHRHHRFYRSWAELPQPAVVVEERSSGTMDEGALRARRRLEEKLGYFRHSRNNGVQANEARGTRQTHNTKDSSSHLITRLLQGKPWKSNKGNSSKGEVCVVCLEDFRSGQQVMELNCTHKYHSKCLAPWLASHPNCPSCRTLVKP